MVMRRRLWGNGSPGAGIGGCYCALEDEAVGEVYSTFVGMLRFIFGGS